MNAYLLVGLGGAIGSIARYGSGVLVGRVWPSEFPAATLTVNIAGSLAMGLLVGWLARTTPAWQGDARAAPVLAALLSLAVVGVVDTLIDSPRLLMLWLLLCCLAADMHRPAPSRGKA